VEVGVGCADLRYSVLAHDGSGVQIVQDVSFEPGMMADEVVQNLPVTLGLDQDADVRSGEQRLQPSSCPGEVERLGKYSRVGAHTQELVRDRPGKEPGKLRERSP
jgi:hypothetical protein